MRLVVAISAAMLALASGSPMYAQPKADCRIDRTCPKPTVRPPAAEGRKPERPARTSNLLTEVRDPVGLARLRKVWGLSLQWVDMSSTPNQYGRARSFNKDGYIHVTGEHRSAEKAASITLDGDVLWVDAKSMVIRGTIVIQNAPSDDPDCTKSGDFYFEIYGAGRKYWRHYQKDGMTDEVKWEPLCPGRPTDYIDIYY